MNDLWKRIFKGWIETYEAIHTIENFLVEEDDASELRCKLLDEIIETCRQEVEK